jgi:ComF family protein
MSYELKMSLIKHARKWRDFILDLIFPVECLGCGSEGDWMCQKCFGRMRFNDTQYCFHCKKEKTFGRFCSSCREFYHLDGILIAGDYEDKLIVNLIKGLKYRFIKEAAYPLSRFLILFLKDLIHRIFPLIQDLNSDQNQLLDNKRSLPKIFVNFKECLIVPIPLHSRRLRWRGFNQAEEIARGLSEYFGVKMATDILLRKKHSQPQVKLNMEERADNIKGCFHIPSPYEGEGKGEVKYLSNRNIILIDDVATTGSTLNEAARVLKENGAGEVWGLVAAKG